MKRSLLFYSPLLLSTDYGEAESPRRVRRFAIRLANLHSFDASSAPEGLHDLQASTPWTDDHPPPLGRSIDFGSEAKGRCRDGPTEEAS